MTEDATPGAAPEPVPPRRRTFAVQGIPDGTPGTAEEWPLHERLAGGAIRAVGAALGFTLPLLFVARVRDWPFVAIGALVACLGLFVPERRDSTLGGAALRLVGTGILTAAAIPVVVLSIEHFGRPQEAWSEIARALERDAITLVLGVAVMGGMGGIYLGLPVLVRSRTDRTGPLLASVAGIGALPWVVSLEAGAVAVALLLSLVLGALGLEVGERLAESYDAHAPKPHGGPVWKAWALWAPLGLFTLCLGEAIPNLGHRRHANAASAVGALKTIATSQSVFREGDKDHDGVLEYAGNLKELEEAKLIDSVLGSGVKFGYLFRMTRSVSTSEFLWCAAADPVTPDPSSGSRYFFTNEAGVVFYTTAAPIPLTEDCAPPAGVIPVGK